VAVTYNFGGWDGTGLRNGRDDPYAMGQAQDQGLVKEFNFKKKSSALKKAATWLAENPPRSKWAYAGIEKWQDGKIVWTSCLWISAILAGLPGKGWKLAVENEPGCMRYP